MAQPPNESVEPDRSGGEKEEEEEKASSRDSNGKEEEAGNGGDKRKRRRKNLVVSSPSTFLGGYRASKEIEKKEKNFNRNSYFLEIFSLLRLTKKRNYANYA